jgi:hypothetical protein
MKTKTFLSLLPFVIVLTYCFWSFMNSLDSQKTWKIIATGTGFFIFLTLGIVAFIRFFREKEI